MTNDHDHGLGKEQRLDRGRVEETGRRLDEERVHAATDEEGALCETGHRQGAARAQHLPPAAQEFVADGEGIGGRDS